MNSNKLAKDILNAHINGNLTLIYEHHEIDIQLNYSGLMATGAYREGWRMAKHKERNKAGCFDFKIFEGRGADREGMKHTILLEDLSGLIQKGSISADMVENVFMGEDPMAMVNKAELRQTLGTVQLAMMEQEINWGNEDFQCWTRYPERPRDYISTYFRRIIVEPDLLGKVELTQAASGTMNVLPQVTGMAWDEFRTPKDHSAEAWLSGDLLELYRSEASKMVDNPFYAGAYEQ